MGVGSIESPIKVNERKDGKLSLRTGEEFIGVFKGVAREKCDYILLEKDGQLFRFRADEEISAAFTSRKMEDIIKIRREKGDRQKGKRKKNFVFFVQCALDDGAKGWRRFPFRDVARNRALSVHFDVVRKGKVMHRVLVQTRLLFPNMNFVNEPPVRFKKVPSPFDVLIDIEHLMKERYSVDDILEGLWTPLPLYNIEDGAMAVLMERTRRSLRNSIRIIMPVQLLSIGMLNKVDERMKRPTASCFFKTKYLGKMPMGRRAQVTKYLKSKGYITCERMDLWRREKRPFDQRDFWGDTDV